MTELLSCGARDALQHEGWLLLDKAAVRLDSMRNALERDAWTDALEERDLTVPVFERLAALLDAPMLPSCLSLRDSDPVGMQRFRRAALSDLDRLRGLYNSLCVSVWRSGSDETRREAVRASAKRWTVGVVVLAAVLASVWGWQRHREAQALAQVNRAKSLAAGEGVKLIAFAAGLAMKTQGRPLEEIVPDMSGACAGVNVQDTLPNHTCRMAWAEYRQTLFRAVVPAPGQPVDCPSELFFDPWGGPYLLLNDPKGAWRALSAGPDGMVGTPDDVAVDIPSR